MADVALVTSSFLPRVGGVEEHVRHVARELRDRGVDVVIWTADRGDSVPTRVDGVPVRVLPTPMPARSAAAVFSFCRRAPVAAWRWWTAWRSDRPSIVHVHCFGPNGAWASTLARLLRIPLIVTSHGETFGDADDVFGSSELMRRALRDALARADAVTACSAFTATDLEDRFGLSQGTARIITNGVDMAEHRGEQLEEMPGRYVCALGRLVGTKGFDLLVEAFADAGLPDDVHLVVGGDGPEADRLTEVARRRGVLDRLHLPGRLSRRHVGPVIAGSLALVVPSRVEPFGIVVLEGWREGVPVIATSHGGPPEFVTDDIDGLIVDPLDTESLAAALRVVVDEPERASRLAAAGRARVEMFGWGRIAEAYLALYREVRRHTALSDRKHASDAP